MVTHSFLFKNISNEWIALASGGILMDLYGTKMHAKEIYAHFLFKNLVWSCFSALWLSHCGTAAVI